MCCFSRPVLMVSATRIFARPVGEARQLLVYGTTVDIPEDLAMVLPIPVPPGSADDAVTFVDPASRAACSIGSRGMPTGASASSS